MKCIQYGTRSLFLLVTACAVFLGLYADRARRQAAAVTAIRAAGGTVDYDFQEKPSGSLQFDEMAECPVPEWLRLSVGVDFFCNAVAAEIDFSDEGARRRLVHESPDEVARHLPALAGIRQLVVVTGLSDEAFLHVGALARLRELNIVDASHITDLGVARLRGLARLNVLRLGDPAIGDESLRTLAALPLLEEIWLDADSAVPASGLSDARSQFTRRARATAITDRGMRYLSGSTRLKALGVSGARLTSEGLKHLRRLRNLRSLSLSDNAGIKDDGMESLAQLASLEDLGLDGTGVTANGVKQLRCLDKLRFLDLSRNPEITDEALRHVAHMANLESLYLDGTRITSRGLDHLKRLTRLADLTISSTGADSTSLERALPGCSVLPSARATDEHIMLLLAAGPAGPRQLLARMLALCDAPEINPACAAQKPQLQELAEELGSPHDWAEASAEDEYERLKKDEYERLKKVVARGDWATRLRLGAGSLEIADQWFERDQAREAWSFLKDASEWLGLEAAASEDRGKDPILRILEGTRRKAKE